MESLHRSHASSFSGLYIIEEPMGPPPTLGNDYKIFIRVAESFRSIFTTGRYTF